MPVTTDKSCSGAALSELDTVAVWFARGVPSRLVWNGVRYRVTDWPTSLADDGYWITHPPEGVECWRFQGTTEEGQSRVFDIQCGSPGWRVLRTYE